MGARRLLGVVVVGAALALGACAKGPAQDERSVLGEPEPARADSGPPVPFSRVRAVAAINGQGVLAVSARAGAPEPVVETTPVEAGTIVDAIVGDINGKPVRASDLFDRKMGPLLAARATEPGVTRDAWRRFAGEQIALELELMLRDELLKAEALASLKPEQQVGLRYLLDELRENARRESAGSRAAMERGWREQDLTEEKWVQAQESEQLIRLLLRSVILPRALVSWQDIELYYERNYKTFNPDPTAVFRYIRVPAQPPEVPERIRAALERGEPFKDVASDPANENRPEEGGLTERTFSGDFAKVDFFGVLRPLNDAARTLTPGEWTREPIVLGDDLAWLYLESIEQVRRPLTDQDVQLEIKSALDAQRRNDEVTKYITRLKKRASFTDLQVMTLQLVDIATARYWPEEKG